MKKQITTLLVFFFLATYLANSKEVVLYEQQLLNLGKMYEKQGNYVNASHIYKSLLNENPQNQEGILRLKKIKPFLQKAKKKKRIRNRNISRKKRRTKSKNISNKYYAVQFLTTSSSYQRQAEKKLERLENRYGFNCYLKEGRYLYLRCNPSKNKSDLKDILRIAKLNRLDHFVVRDTNPPIFDDYKKPPAIQKPRVETPRPERPAIQKPRPERPAIQKPRVERPTIQKPRVERPAIQQPRPERPAIQKPRVERPAIQKPRPERPAIQKPRPERPAIQQPRPKKPAIQKPKPKKPAIHKLSALDKLRQKRANDKKFLLKKPNQKKPLNLSKKRKRKMSKFLKRPSLPKDLKKHKSRFTLKEGYDALNNKNMPKAKEVFSDLIKFNRSDEGAIFGLALVFMNEGDWTKAYITLKPIAKTTKRKDIKDTFKGITYNMYLKKGWKNVATKPADSVKYFLEAQKLKDSSDISEGLSYAYNNNNQSKKAIPHVMKVYKKKRDFKSAKMMIQTYLKAEQLNKAEEFFNTLEPSFQVNMKYNPKKTKALAEVRKLLKEEDYRKAKGILKELYLLYPTDLDVLYYLGAVYSGEKKYKKAIEYFQTVLSREADHKNALFALSKIYMAQGKNEKAYKLLRTLQKNKVKVADYIDEVRLKMFLAKKEYKKAKKLAKSMLLDDPTNVELYIILGDLSKETKNPRDAYFYYAKAYQMEPDNFSVRMKLLNMLLEQKLFDQIQIILEKFNGFKFKDDKERQQLKDFYKKYYKNYTAVSLAEEDYEYALMSAKAGLQMMPNDFGLMESAGWAALNSKKYPQAVYYFSKITTQKPKAYSQRYGLGLAYINMKQIGKAKIALKEAEQTQDKDLLYKIAEIYKDVGLKKDAYRVIKLLEKTSTATAIKKFNPVKKQKKKKDINTKPIFSSKNQKDSEIESNPNRDTMNTFNPFLQDEAPIESIITTVPAKEEILPMPQTKKKSVKKKSGRWF